jgi:hypothetical protein
MEVSCACEIFKSCREGDAKGAQSVLSVICGGVSVVIHATCLLSDFSCETETGFIDTIETRM